MATTAAAPSSRFETIKVLPDTRRLFFFLVSNKLRKPLPTNASLSTATGSGLKMNTQNSIHVSHLSGQSQTVKSIFKGL